jgi:hypothetical protein
VAQGSETFQRFMASTAIDYMKWHDGEPYDLEALTALRGDERDAAEFWLLERADKDWRDLEGLLALGTPRARDAVLRQLRHGRLEQRLSAARRLADDPATSDDREAAVIEGLRRAKFGSGLSDALDVAIEHPTPAVRDALLRATMRSESGAHAAAALEFLAGLAREPFDWARRPFYLRFNEPAGADGQAAFRELCAELGVDPAPYLEER